MASLAEFMCVFLKSLLVFEIKLIKPTQLKLTSRDIQRGSQAVNSVQSSIVHYHQLDIGDLSSIEQFRQYIVDNYNGFDVLVQNAAIADHGRPGGFLTIIYLTV